MTTIYETRYAIGQQEAKGYDTQALRDAFLADKLMQPGKIYWVYSHYERFMVGGAVPVKSGLTLDTLDALKSACFTARREVGVINVGGSGSIAVDDTSYALEKGEALYIGAGEHSVTFYSENSDEPARFYLNSAPAHASYPCKKVGKEEANVLHLGSPETANQRDIHQLIINGVVDTCQLQMGLTRLYPGSVWNTMPAHQHDRRNEVYFYLDVPEGQAVSHFMGEPHETRHIFVQNHQAILSPPWSIHCGCGTANYAFIWGMAGENLDYDDMDKFPASELR
ncbi:5-dehydro-4-deoxy-D-glucuronate isomerase [uncultured Alteromonas sp.]|jgi:4-deoxy-L-threo-5-hexosulose-uronate ketol-isomerase|uniref:5-dehydro-4-deoxy-D-glucuronate isomerase n=1 Tax=uncultured Alteromonas sp. TaxID=179113 RepID=UPI0025E3C3E2|nr:5-dehydro-4-deoxy-D-glucuronate isomerase [uncultured Alteromonas sp.]